MIAEEDLELNLLVSNVLSEKRYSHCRLCLKDIQDQYVRIQDSVTLDVRNFVNLADILSNLLGPEVCEEIIGLEAVCMSCVDKAIEAQNFLEKCKNSTKVLNNVFDNLTNTLDVDVENANPDHNLYVIVGEYESKLVLVNNQHSVKRTRSKFYACTHGNCSEQFDDITDFKVHNLTSHGLLICDKCCYATTSVDELTAHLNSQHKYRCTSCTQFRCTQESLKDHEDNAHGTYVCKDCGKSFKGLDKLQTHEHKHSQKSECPKCGKSYNTKEFFVKHVKLCMEDLLDPHPMRSKIQKTYFCNKCGKGYSTPGGLRVHERFVHDNAKPHVCKYCNKQFTAPSYLKVHMIKHTGEKNFQCDMCPKKFVSKEALLYHKRRHTGEKPYSCTMCDERFVNSSARAEHIKFKHVGPTLMCEICSRKFVTKNFLRQHMLKHHDPSNKLYTGRSLIPPNVPAVENMRVRFID